MLYESVKIPLWREYLFSDLNLKIYDEFNNRIFDIRKDLLFEEDGKEKVRLMQPGLGLSYNPTLEEFIIKFIFGLSATHKISYDIDLNDLLKSRANGVPLRLSLQYKLENIFKTTQAEKKVLKALHSRYCKQSFRKRKLMSVERFGEKRNWFEIYFQAITPVDKRFFCLDFLISSPLGKLAIEIDGEYHNSDFQQEKDQERMFLIMEKYKTQFLRFSNTEIFSMSEIEIVDKILDKFSNLSNEFEDTEYLFKSNQEKIFLDLKTLLSKFSLREFKGSDKVTVRIRKKIKTGELLVSFSDDREWFDIYKDPLTEIKKFCNDNRKYILIPSRQLKKELRKIKR